MDDDDFFSDNDDADEDDADDEGSDDGDESDYDGQDDDEDDDGDDDYDEYDDDDDDSGDENEVENVDGLLENDIVSESDNVVYFGAGDGHRMVAEFGGGDNGNLAVDNENEKEKSGDSEWEIL